NDVSARVEELEERFEEACRVADDHTLELQTLNQRTAAAFTLGQLTDAVKLQFETITADRDTMLHTINVNAAKQAKVNQAYDAKVVAMEAEIRQMGANIVHMSLAPSAPLPLGSDSRLYSDSRRSRSPFVSANHHPRSPPAEHSRRSRSSRSPPANDHTSKRFHSASEDEHVITIVELGPTRFGATMPPVDAFRLHMDTALPDYDRSHPVRIMVERVDDFLHLELPSKKDAQALVEAWNAHTVIGYKSVKMVLAGGGKSQTNAGHVEEAPGGSKHQRSRPFRRNGGGNRAGGAGNSSKTQGRF
ncbi:hypothetical protein C8F04DRAFT_1106153, partial [Mycena alexandri]